MISTRIILQFLLISILFGIAFPQEVNQTQDEINAAEAEKREYKKFLESQRILAYSCIYVTRYYLLKNDKPLKELKEISGAYRSIRNKDERKNEELKVWRRIYTDGVKLCASKQTPERAQKIFKELQEYKLDVTQYYDLVESLNFEIYKNKQAKLVFDTEEEEAIWRLIEGYEKALEEKNQKEKKSEVQQEPPVQDSDRSDQNLNEPQVFGQSLQIDTSLQILVLIFIFGLFGLILYFVYRGISKGDSQSPKKQKKNKQK